MSSGKRDIISSLLTFKLPVVMSQHRSMIITVERRVCVMVCARPANRAVKVHTALLGYWRGGRISDGRRQQTAGCFWWWWGMAPLWICVTKREKQTLAKVRDTYLLTLTAQTKYLSLPCFQGDFPFTVLRMQKKCLPLCFKRFWWKFTDSHLQLHPWESPHLLGSPGLISLPAQNAGSNCSQCENAARCGASCAQARRRRGRQPPKCSRLQFFCFSVI